MTLMGETSILGPKRVRVEVGSLEEIGAINLSNIHTIGLPAGVTDQM